MTGRVHWWCPCVVVLTPRDNEWLILLVEQPEPQARALGHVLAPVLESVPVPVQAAALVPVLVLTQAGALAPALTQAEALAPVPVQAAASVPLPTQVLALALESVQEPVSTLVVALVTVPT